MFLSKEAIEAFKAANEGKDYHVVMAPNPAKDDPNNLDAIAVITRANIRLYRQYKGAMDKDPGKSLAVYEARLSLCRACTILPPIIEHQKFFDDYPAVVDTIAGEILAVSGMTFQATSEKL